jgi:6-methylsalicylic acid synthase
MGRRKVGGSMWAETTQGNRTGDADVASDPIAIVGMGCRFPGGITSPQEYWDFLMSGKDSRREIPPQRWESYASKGPEYARAVRRAIKYGSYLDDIEGFDAEFFGISPREAQLMDPQQRMTLEVTWEALERAGIAPGGLRGSDTGVFMGVCTDDYGRRMLEDLPRLEAWMGIGSSLCGVANRVSYILDLRGPSIAIDTACSASLVAIHQACQSLRLGETSLALAGGVMLVASPSYHLVLDAAGALSQDGRSRAFDASASGYGRGEGCGVLVLRRLSDAMRNGEPILAIVRGSAVCQDGRTNGIMAPSRDAQEHLAREACRNAGIAPSSLDYVEAHGTGTGLGDPIEASALARVVGVGRPADQPCLIGSVKTNIGHLEAASGVAGIIKLVLAMNHGLIPATLLATGPNPAIAWEESGLHIVTEATNWPCTDHTRRGSVSNYGYGGTIANVIVEQAPGTQRTVQANGPVLEDPRVYPLYGGSAAGVRENAARLAAWLADHESVPLDWIGHTLAHRRSPLHARACVVAADRGQLVEGLTRLAEDRVAPGVSVDDVASNSSSQEAVWVFSGHGAQWPGMGRELLSSEPIVEQAIDELEPVYVEEMGFSPRRALMDGDFQEVDRAQALIFAMQVGLARLLLSRGLRPAAIIGHSVGEIAAAVTAGMLDLHDAARLICRRSLLLRRAAGEGAMAMVSLPFEEVAARLTADDGVAAAIAAAPRSTVLSGPASALAHIIAQWRSEGLAISIINSDVAFHSPQMDDLSHALRSEVAWITPRQPSLPVYTTALSDPRSSAPRDASYWAANLRNPVHLREAVTAAVDDGHNVFLEVSAHPVVSHSIAETLTATGVPDSLVVYTLRRDRPERETLLHNLGRLHCHGVTVDWSALQPSGQLADVPTTAWQHKRYWLEPGPMAAGAGGQHDVDSHTLLGPRTAIQAQSPLCLWQTYLDYSSRPYPGTHTVLGTEIIPAAVTLNSFVEAAELSALTDVSLRIPITVTANRELQVLRQEGVLRLSSRLAGERDDGAWLTHATAGIADAPADGGRLDIPALTAARADNTSPGAVMERLVEIGVDGVGFPWKVDDLRHGGESLLARVSADPHGAMPLNTWSSLLDAALSIAPMVFPGEPRLRMPGSLREVVVYGAAPSEAAVSVRLIASSGDGDMVEVDIVIAAPDGTVAAKCTGVTFEAVQVELYKEHHEEAPGEDAEWFDLEGSELHDHLIGAIREIAAREMRIDPAELDVHRPLIDMGADSLITVEITRRLERRFGVSVPGTLLWDRPTVAAVAGYLTEYLAESLQMGAAA